MLAALISGSNGSHTCYEKRLAKILKYVSKKSRRYMNSAQQKLDCFHQQRHEVAEKRLRVRGRFVNKKQALSMLGLKTEDLLRNDELMRLCDDLPSSLSRLDSIYQSKDGQQTKIANLQKLLSSTGLL